MLDTKLKIFSMAALMSVERLKPENSNIGTEDKIEDEFSRLPLIFTLIESAKSKKLVLTTEEYVRKYLIDGFLEVIERLTFEEGIFIEPHSQNLCIVLDKDLIPVGFAYRDLGGVAIDIITRAINNRDISKLKSEFSPKAVTYKSSMAIENSYVKNYVWFYSYQVLNKLLNVLTNPGKDDNAEIIEMTGPPRGAPFQIGFDNPIPERNLFGYMIKQLDSKESIEKLKSMVMPVSEVNKLLYEFDQKYQKMLEKYFLLENIRIKLIDGMLPNAEGGAKEEHRCKQHNGFMGNQKGYTKLKSKYDQQYHPIEYLPIDINALNSRTISSFKLNKGFEDLNIHSFVLGEQGVWFLDDNKEYVGFMPYKSADEADMIRYKIGMLN